MSKLLILGYVLLIGADLALMALGEYMWAILLDIPIFFWGSELWSTYWMRR